MFSSPAAASHDTLPCSPPSSLDPLFQLLHTVEQLAYIAGIGIGTIGFLIAAVYLMLPGQDTTRRGKMIAKNVLIGTVLLLSAKMIMGFLLSQLGGTICT